MERRQTIIDSILSGNLESRVETLKEGLEYLTGEPVMTTMMGWVAKMLCECYPENVRSWTPVPASERAAMIAHGGRYQREFWAGMKKSR